MSVSINEKRNKLREDIRKRQRSEFFMKERMKMLSNYHHQAPVTSLVQNLRNRQQLPETLNQICKIVNGASYELDTVQMIEQGLTSVLMSFLSEKIYLKETLEIISYILQKNVPHKHSMNYFQRFYSFGLLEYLIKLIPNKELSSFCVFILYRYSEQHQDYCEALIFGEGYKILIECFVSRFRQSEDPELQNQKEGNKFYTYILTTLENIVMMKESALDLQANKLQIFRFITDLIEKRCFLTLALGMFYEFLRNMGNRLAEGHIKLINQLGETGQESSKYYHNCLAIIYQITPHREINYAGCLFNAIKMPKHNKLISLILLRMLKSEIKEIIQQIPIESTFWQKLMINQPDQNYTSRLMTLIASLPLEKNTVWRFIASTLDTDSSLNSQIEALDYINAKLLSPEKEPNLLFNLQKHQIIILLQELSDRTKSSVVNSKALSILDYILGPFSEMNNEMVEQR